MFSLDLQISQYFFELGRNLPSVLVRFLATDLFWVLLIFILIASWQGSHSHRLRLFLWAVAAAVAALAANFIIGWLYFRSRPFVDLSFLPIVPASALDKSFPSDHAALSFALALTVFRQHKKSGLVALTIALLISLGRVLAGVHYFSDILAGAGLGALISYLFSRYAKRAGMP